MKVKQSDYRLPVSWSDSAASDRQYLHHCGVQAFARNLCRNEFSVETFVCEIIHSFGVGRKGRNFQPNIVHFWAHI